MLISWCIDIMHIVKFQIFSLPLPTFGAKFQYNNYMLSWFLNDTFGIQYNDAAIHTGRFYDISTFEALPITPRWDPTVKCFSKAGIAQSKPGIVIPMFKLDEISDWTLDPNWASQKRVQNQKSYKVWILVSLFRALGSKICCKNYVRSLQKPQNEA